MQQDRSSTSSNTNNIHHSPSGGGVLIRKSVFYFVCSLFVQCEQLWNTAHLKLLLFQTLNNVLLLRWATTTTTTTIGGQVENGEDNGDDDADDDENEDGNHDDNNSSVQERAQSNRLRCEFELELASLLLRIYRSFVDCCAAVAAATTTTVSSSLKKKRIAGESRNKRDKQCRVIALIQLWYVCLPRRHQIRVRSAVIRQHVASLLFSPLLSTEQTIVERNRVLLALISLYSCDGACLGDSTDTVANMLKLKAILSRLLQSTVATVCHLEPESPPLSKAAKTDAPSAEKSEEEQEATTANQLSFRCNVINSIMRLRQRPLS